MGKRCPRCRNRDTTRIGDLGPEHPHHDAWWCDTCNNEFVVVAVKHPSGCVDMPPVRGWLRWVEADDG